MTVMTQNAEAYIKQREDEGESVISLPVTQQDLQDITNALQVRVEEFNRNRQQLSQVMGMDYELYRMRYQLLAEYAAQVLIEARQARGK